MFGNSDKLVWMLCQRRRRWHSNQPSLSPCLPFLITYRVLTRLLHIFMDLMSMDMSSAVMSTWIIKLDSHSRGACQTGLNHGYSGWQVQFFVRYLKCLIFYYLGWFQNLFYRGCVLLNNLCYLCYLSGSETWLGMCVLLVAAVLFWYIFYTKTLWSYRKVKSILKHKRVNNHIAVSNEKYKDLSHS